MDKEMSKEQQRIGVARRLLERNGFEFSKEFRREAYDRKLGKWLAWKDDLGGAGGVMDGSQLGKRIMGVLR